MNISTEVAAKITADILAALGAIETVSARVATSLVLAERRGFATHGLGLLPLYKEMASAGAINPKAMPVATNISPGIGRVAGEGAFGQVTGKCAADFGLELVKTNGIAAVGITDGTHLGRLGEYAEMACKAGCAFIATSNTGGGALTVAGAGGSARVLAPNPIAIGVPTNDALSADVIVDFATSQVSGSRIREAANSGTALDKGWTVKTDGSVTDDPQDFLDGLAALYPLGGTSAGHKGFGLMVATELLSSLAGGLMAGETDTPWFSNGAMFLFLDINRFVPYAEWQTRSKHFADYIGKKGYRLPGSGSTEAPGNVIDLADYTLAAIIDLAESLNVDTRGLQKPTAAGVVTRTW